MGTGDTEALKKDIRITTIASVIIGKTVWHDAYGQGTVVSCDEMDGADSIDISFNGEVTSFLYPHVFCRSASFEDAKTQKLVENHVELVLSFYEVGAALGYGEFQYALAGIYMDTNPTKALDYMANAAKSGLYEAQNALLMTCVAVSESGISADESILQYALAEAKKQAKKRDYLAQYNLAQWYEFQGDYKTAASYFDACAGNQNAIDVTRATAAITLAEYYREGKRDDAGRAVVFKNYQSAKKYYEIASQCGYDCDADLAYINRSLGIELKHNLMQVMARRIIDSGKSNQECYEYILNDMQHEFDGLWDYLPRESQIDLVSGCVVYVNLFALGEAVCQQLDFSSAIIPIVKACEVVFRKYLCFNYYDYLIDNNINIQILGSSHPFVECDKRGRPLRYKHRESIVFMLGSIKHLVLSEGSNSEISPVFLRYARTIVNPTLADRQTLENYFVRLARRMNQFTFDIRNPAAHSDIMPFWQAEICGNEIIMVRKILKDFLSKIKFL